MLAFQVVFCSIVAIGCSDEVDVRKVQLEVRRLAKVDSVEKAGKLAEHIVSLNLQPRLSSDSLAHADSLSIAWLYRARTSYYYHKLDTVMAIFSFIETIPWTEVYGPLARAQFWRFYAEDAGQALMITQSPNMARLTYDAFVQAERFAKQYEDSTFYAYVLETKREFHRNLLTLPDSVRMAYRPLELPSPRSLRLHAIVLAFIVLGGSAGGFHLWQRHKRRRQHAANLTVRARSSSV